MAVLIIVPLILTAAGFICTEEKRKGIYCTLLGIVLLFAFIFRYGTGDYDAIVSFLDFVPTLGFDSLTGIAKPDGLIYSAYFFKGLCENNQFFFYAASAVWALLISLYVYKRCSTPYASAVVFFCSGFFLLSAYDFSAFTASLIIAYAFISAEEQRFFRFATLILFASLFDITAIVLLPFFFLLQIRETVGFIASILGCAAAAAGILAYPDFTDKLFSFLPTYSSPISELNASVPLIFITALFLIIAVLARKMLKKHDNLSGVYITALIFGTMFLFLSYFDGRFSALAFFFLMPSVTILSGEIFYIGKQLLILTFGGKNRTALIIGGIISAIIAFSVCGYFLISDFYGINPYNISLFGEGI